jgi:hypothetical protein
VTTMDAIKMSLVFVNAFAGLIAAYPGADLDGSVRLVCAALVAGCGAALLFMQKLGGDIDYAKLAEEQERQRQARVRATLERKATDGVREAGRAEGAGRG